MPPMPDPDLPPALRPTLAPRYRLLELARRDPGIHLAEAARVLGVDPSTANYHARVLVARGSLLLIRRGRAAALFANGDGTCAWMRAALPALRDPAVQEAAALVLESPRPHRDLCARLGLPRGRAHRVLHRLARLGALAEEAPGVWSVPAARAPCLERALRREGCRDACSAPPPAPPRPRASPPSRPVPAQAARLSRCAGSRSGRRRAGG